MKAAQKSRVNLWLLKLLNALAANYSPHLKVSASYIFNKECMLLCLIASWLKPRLSAGLVLRWLQGQQSLVCMLFSDELGILTCDMPKALTAETTGHGQ